MYEYAGITLWQGNSDIVEYIKKKYPHSMFHTFEFTLEEKHKIASKIYSPDKI